MSSLSAIRLRAREANLPSGARLPCRAAIGVIERRKSAGRPTTTRERNWCNQNGHPKKCAPARCVEQQLMARPTACPPPACSRTFRKARSIVAAFIVSRPSRPGAPSCRWPCRSMASTRTGNNGRSLFPHTRSGGLPDHNQCLADRVIADPPSRSGAATPARWATTKQTHRMLPVKPGYRHKFVEMRDFSKRAPSTYRAAIAPTNSSRVVMLTRLINAPAAEHPRGANQMRQRVNSRQHFRRGNAPPGDMLTRLLLTHIRASCVSCSKRCRF